MSLDGKYCPNCRAEYIEGWGRCEKCDVALVATLDPAEPIQAGDGDEADPFVMIWEGPTREGQVFARLLEAAHVPIDMGEAAERGYCRIHVPRSYVQDAYDTLDQAKPSQVREAMRAPVDEPLDEGLPFWLRVVIGVVAALVIIALFLSQI